ncbi:Uma2 family endonuclease [Membranicola marinus]|uniref:Uma2 family endonuclease n=1 Tax=Membranihabitans marinus TaxID=1227546 RepID=A0A953HT52_9BACT|nr:Uma2 family endonuclease [Membranihabitans marinus]MBY5957741.1 Uma2 family endonuclease [Membranihabitans marinus]
METATIQSPPRTMMEVFKSLPEGTLVQLIENNLTMAPAPRPLHQEILNDINFELLKFVKQEQTGTIYTSPIDVYLDDQNIFQPDILFISNDNKGVIRDDGLHGAPDLVIELLSSSTAKYDLHEKKDVYERSGVKEYWIVDPETKEVQGYFLEKGGYGEPVIEKGIIHSRMLDYEFNF